MALKKEDVLKIKQGIEDGRSRKELADEWGVTVGTIGHIITGTTWSHVRLPGDRVSEDDVLNGKPEPEVAVKKREPEVKSAQETRIADGVENIKAEQALSTIRLLGKKNEELDGNVKKIEEDVDDLNKACVDMKSKVEGHGADIDTLKQQVHVNASQGEIRTPILKRINDIDIQVSSLQSLAEDKRQKRGSMPFDIKSELEELAEVLGLHAVSEHKHDDSAEMLGYTRGVVSTMLRHME